MENKKSARSHMITALGQYALNGINDALFNAMVAEVATWEDDYQEVAAEAIVFGYALAIGKKKG